MAPRALVECGYGLSQKNPARLRCSKNDGEQLEYQEKRKASVSSPWLKDQLQVQPTGPKRGPLAKQSLGSPWHNLLFRVQAYMRVCIH